MKKTVLLVAALLFSNVLFAADKSEEGVPTSPLKIYSAGVSVGVTRAVNDEMKKDVGRSFLSLSFSNVFSIRKNADLFLDISAIIPNENYGADFGADFILNDSDFRPFAGVGIGGHYINHTGEFSDDFGPSITAHLGLTLDINETVAVRIRAPYHMVMNKFNDQTVGVDLTFLFSSKYKNVKKLQYN